MAPGYSTRSFRGMGALLRCFQSSCQWKNEPYYGLTRMVPVTPAPAFAPKETGGSPEFPDYPFDPMPRSQTPVVSRSLALARTGLLPSGHSMPSALGPVARAHAFTTIIHFSEFHTAAWFLALPLHRTVPLSTRPSVRLPTGWLAFGRVGLDGSWPSHPLGNVDEFQGESPLFSRPGFSSARGAAGWGGSLRQPFAAMPPYRGTMKNTRRNALNFSFSS